tara:strand:+ start:362 stop:739 length:378 start_codon:yes stop_codon:yes gene_type:complete
MDEQLLNEYINNLANQVNSLTQENILLKTRLSIFERREQERLQQEAEAKEELQEEVAQPEPPQEEEPAAYEDSELTIETRKPLAARLNEEKEIPPLVRGPKPKGYNPKVDGPLPLIPNPKLAQKE